MSKPRSSTAWMPRAELQRVIGRSRAEVDQLLAEGLPHETVGSGRGATIRIPRDAAMAWLAGRSTGRRPRPTEPATPPCALILSEIEGRTERGMVIAALEAIYSTTWFGRFIAMEEGVDPERAEMIGSGVSLMLVEHFERTFRRAGIAAFQPADPDWLQPEQCWWSRERGLREDLTLPAPAAP